MLSSNEFIKQSLELHLFFARIMKEHSFFLQVAFTPKDKNYIMQADAFRMEFDRLLSEAVSLSEGVVSRSVIESGEIVTPYTLESENLSSFYTGVRIQTNITEREMGLSGDGMSYNPMLERMVSLLNQKAIELVVALVHFKSTILSNVITCRMFTNNYPLLIDHILREAEHYLKHIYNLQNAVEIDKTKEIGEHELFWNRIMAEHSKFIRGLLDPTEDELINAANNFGHQFDELTLEAKQAIDKTIPIETVTEDSLRATEAVQKFNTQGTKGLIDCKIKSIIIPLLGDHVLRESNHYLRLLNTYEKVTT